MENTVINMTKKDLFNAKNSSIDIKSHLGEIMTVSGIAVLCGQGSDRDGNPVDIAYIATDKGVFGTISATVIKSMQDFADYLNDCFSDGEEVKIRFVDGKSKNGIFYKIEIV